MNNMEIYEAVKDVPDYAKKTISGGRMNGKTDISPMWRIQVLTENFGPCGIGWKYEITGQRLEKGGGKEVKAFVDINLYIKWGESWSEAIPGIGGNSYIDKQGYTNDECFKMALSDAISVAAKALGVGASVYMGGDTSKYTGLQREAQNNRLPPPPRPSDGTQPVAGSDGYYYCADCGNIIQNQKLKDGQTMYPKDVAALGLRLYGAQLCGECMKKRRAQRETE